MNGVYKKFLIVMLGCVLCTQFTSQDSSVTGKEKPRVNFQGILRDNTGNQYEVNNITISGLYKQIPVYTKPDDPTINPDINITRLDLAEIKEIKTIRPINETTQKKELLPPILRFNNRDYIEIEVVSNDAKQTKNRYIVERTKKIYCDEVNDAGPIEKELSFLALDTLTINSYLEKPTETNAKNLEHSCDYSISQTKALIHKLEQTTHQLPNEPNTTGSIKNRLLQLLDDIKHTLRRWF